MGKIDKEQFLTSLSCPTYGWLLRPETTPKPLSVADQLRIDEGIEVHQRARALFPTGVMVSGPTDTAVQATQQLLSDPKTTVIFEATFVYQDYIAKADILIRDDDDNAFWKIIEVKSNVNDTPVLVDDLAYTTFVAQAAGLSLSTCSLLLVNRNYRLGMSDGDLFNEVQHTSEVIARATEFKEQSDEIAQILMNDQKPEPVLRRECKDCDIFEECCGQNIENHIFDLPRLSFTKFCQLRDMDVVTIEEIPADFELSNNQDRVKQAVLSGQPFVDIDGLRQALNSLESPIHYLDFETTQTCIPLTEAYRPSIQLARLIILNFSPDLKGGRENILAILFDMNKLFEKFIYRRLKREENNFGEYELCVKGQTSREFWQGTQG